MERALTIPVAIEIQVPIEEIVIRANVSYECGETVTKTSGVFLRKMPATSTEPGGFWHISGSAKTDKDGRFQFRVNELLRRLGPCLKNMVDPDIDPWLLRGDYIAINERGQFLATAESDSPTIATFEIRTSEADPATYLQFDPFRDTARPARRFDVEIVVYLWDSDGKPVPDVHFSWFYRARGGWGEVPV